MQDIKTRILNAMHTHPDGHFGNQIYFKCSYKFVPFLNSYLLSTVYVDNDDSKSNIVNVTDTCFSIDAKLYVKDSSIVPRDMHDILMFGGNQLRLVPSAHHTNTEIPFHCELSRYTVDDIEIEHISGAGVDEIILCASRL